MIKHFKKGSALNLLKGFTLVELLVVMGVLAVLGATAVLVANPIEMARQSRDTRRVGDITAIQGAIETAQAGNPNISLGTSNATVYVSIPDPMLSGIATSTCGGVIGMPTLPSGWQYQCVSPENLKKTDGTGWIPVNFDSLPTKSALSSLPIDPKNEVAGLKFYTYIPYGGLVAKLESKKNVDIIGAKDGGIDDTLYELGKSPNPIALPVAPTVVTNAASVITQTTANLNGSVNPNGSGTTAWFRYVANSNPMSCDDVFGTATAAQNKGNGSLNVSYVQNVTGLSPVTNYYFCAIAQNASGKVFGLVQSFTTLGNVWAKLTPSGTAPPIRYNHSAAWDAARNKMYVFGGNKDSVAFSVPLNDLWAYDATANSWTQLTPSGTAPVQRSNHTAVWDAARNKMYIFGGFRQNIPTSLNDLWAYDATANSWTQLTPSGTAPDGRYAHTAVWDATRSKMYVFGGYSNNTGLYYNDIWAYDATANSWTKLTPSGLIRPLIAYHSAVWDAARNKMYTFGGYNGTSYFNDFWVYDVVANTWSSITPSGTAPGKRYYHTAVWDASGSNMYMFGGYGTALYYNDLWSYSATTNAWLKLLPSGTAPSGRDMHSAVWDTTKNRMYIFGGWNSGGWYNDLWSYAP